MCIVWGYHGDSLEVVPGGTLANGQVEGVDKWETRQWSPNSVHDDSSGLSFWASHWFRDPAKTGEQIIDLDLSKTGLKNRPLEGYIGFQDEAKFIWYRNVRIKELKNP